jgi:hypothetical protein
MKKLIGGVKRIFSSGPSSRGSGSCYGDGSQDLCVVPHRDVVGGVRQESRQTVGQWDGVGARYGGV